ncbi:D-cysteine desulfhydrase [Chitinispirillum alkaliphilum]|nr:D-cysteine desulfhydrase [Chitinispirillum alkaliphilum]
MSLKKSDKMQLPVFRYFPGLVGKLPFYSISTYPTPLKHLKNFSRNHENTEIFIKRDDLSGTIYGGNKIRKLEFLIGQAKAQNSERIVTSGAAGSNHALASAIYSKLAGFKTTLLLCDQPNSPAVRENLIADLSCGAQIKYLNSWNTLSRCLQEENGRSKESRSYVIPAGGSSALGTVGFVNAGLELAEQIREDVIPCPERIFVAIGTMGTAAGLLLGLRAAGLQIPLTGVRVVPSFVANEGELEALFVSTNQLLHDLSPSFPIIHLKDGDISIDHSQFGSDYGETTLEAKRVKAELLDSEQISLDMVYTGKAFSGLVSYLKGKVPEKNILFWHTKNSRTLPWELREGDYHHLPPGLSAYFKSSDRA